MQTIFNEVNMANKVVICGVDTSTLPKCNNQKLEELMKEIKRPEFFISLVL